MSAFMLFIQKLYAMIHAKWVVWGFTFLINVAGCYYGLQLMITREGMASRMTAYTSIDSPPGALITGLTLFSFCYLSCSLLIAMLIQSFTPRTRIKP